MAQTLTSLLALLLLITVSSTIPNSVLGASPHIQALVAPITKDNPTSLYTISLNNHNPFLLDLAGPLLLSPCPPDHPTVLCNSTTCATARSFPPPHCPRVTPVFRNPCTCSVYSVNPVTGECRYTDLTLTDVTIASTNGSSPTAPVTVPGVVASCAPQSLLSSLPTGTVGVAGLGRPGESLQSQLTTSLSLEAQFAICLPSTSAAPGVAFFGSQPFNLMPPTPFDAATILAYTPLLKNPMNPGYYIDVQCVAVNGKLVRFLSRVLGFDSLGRGGVKLSTAVPYTVLHGHVYRPFLKAFADATRGIPRAPKVAPFELCMKSSALGFTRVGYAVPQIDVMLADGKNWTIFGANSMVQVNPETVCLAVVNGGMKAEQAAVIGGFQMENNFLLFDVGRSRLGFSSTLLFIRTTCGNFNFAP